MWHERYISAIDPRNPLRMAVLSPEFEHQVEDYSLESNAIQQVHLLPNGRGTQPDGGLGGAHVHRFRGPIPPAQLRQMAEHGAVMVRASLPVGFTAPEDTVFPPHVVAPLGVARRAAQAGHLPPAGLIWVWVVDAPWRSRSSTFADLPAGANVVGNRAIFPFDSPVGAPVGVPILMRCILQADLPKDVFDDLQLMPVQINSGGWSHRAFQVTIAGFCEEEAEGGLYLDGPTSIAWLALHALDTGGSFYLRHLNWTRTSGLSWSLRFVREHELISRSLDALLTTDQLKLPALAGAELWARRLQLLEEALRVSPHSPDYSGSSHFMGLTMACVDGAIAPLLRIHAADNLRGEAAGATESRDAREEGSA